MMSIDPQSRVPIYEQIYRGVTELAANKLLSPGEKLPSVRELSKRYSINPNTVAKAFGMLERDGIIYSVPGKGSFLSGGHEDVILSNACREFEEAAVKAHKSGLSQEKMIEIVKETGVRK
ncbi:MAG: GntR family transcriptional regulator [Oscillospiraceae bacterium]|nr:GntR family transcriptional regulator [Oscillospiraceae bacterium]